MATEEDSPRGRPIDREEEGEIDRESASCIEGKQDRYVGKYVMVPKLSNKQ